MIGTSRTSRRLLAVLLLLAAVALIMAVTVVPSIVASRHYDESIAELQFRLAKYQQMAGREEQLKVRLDDLRRQRLAGDDLLQGESTAIAGASLQKLLKDTVQNAGGRLESTQIIAGSNGDALEKIAVRAQFTGSIQSLQRALFDIEFGQPILFVDQLEVRIKKSRRRGRNKVQRSEELLKVTLEVSGYRRTEEQG